VEAGRSVICRRPYIVVQSGSEALIPPQLQVRARASARFEGVRLVVSWADILAARRRWIVVEALPTYRPT
jgi:hypothetical protein